VLILVLVAAGAALAGGLLAGRLLGLPEAAQGSAPEASPGLRFQQVLAELAMRAAGVSPGEGPLAVTSAELNAFLARHVEGRRLAFRPLRVRAEAGRLEFAGRTTLERLGGSSRLGRLLAHAPAAVREIEVWVSARGPLRIAPGEAELVVEETRIGRQRVPAAWLWRAIEVDPREQLRWRLPRVIERIELEPDRLLIHTRRRGR
jgi:hypothetical protein